MLYLQVIPMVLYIWLFWWGFTRVSFVDVHMIHAICQLCLVVAGSLGDLCVENSLITAILQTGKKQHLCIYNLNVVTF